MLGLVELYRLIWLPFSLFIKYNSSFCTVCTVMVTDPPPPCTRILSILSAKKEIKHTKNS